MSFFPDLVFGNRIQNEVIGLYEFDSYRIMKGNFIFFDVVGVKGGKAFFYEFKADRRACKTGNIAIEYQNNWNASGIAASHADVWVYVLVNEQEEVEEVFHIPTRRLKMMVKDKLWHRTSQTPDKKAHFYLFQKELFEEFSIFKVFYSDV